MATIIQPYNYAREITAMNLLGGLLTDALQRHNEANKNRKVNTAIGTALQNLGSLGQQSMMNGQPVPEGYNDDQWAKAAHKSYTPMTQYDIGTADITPQYQSMPTAMDVQKSLAETLANPRFAMVNSTQAQQALTPYLQSLEQANTLQRRTDAANAMSKADNDQAKLAAMLRGGIMGDISSDLIKLAQEQYKFDNPNQEQYTQNRGQTTAFGSYNPRTGEYTPRGFYKNTLTPQQAADLALKRYDIDNRTALGYDTNDVADRRNYLDYTLKSDDLEERKFQYRNPHLIAHPGTDGNMYWLDSMSGEVMEMTLPDGTRVSVSPEKASDLRIMQDANGELVVVDPKTAISTPVRNATTGSAQTGKQTNKSMTNTQKQNVTDLNSTIKSLKKQIEEAEFYLGLYGEEEQNTTEYQESLAKVEELRAKLNRARRDRDSILQEADGVPTLQAEDPQEKQPVQELTPPTISNDVTQSQNLLTLQPEVSKDVSPQPPAQQQTRSPHPQSQELDPSLLPPELQPTPQNMPLDLLPPISSDHVINPPKRVPKKTQVTQETAQQGETVLDKRPSMRYEEGRDRYRPKEQVYSQKQFNDFLRSVKASDPILSQLSDEEILEILEEEGYRIKE